MGCVGCVRRFSPPLSLSLSLSLSFVEVFYRLSTFFAVIVPKLFDFRYPTLLVTRHTSTIYLVQNAEVVRTSTQSNYTNHAIKQSSSIIFWYLANAQTRQHRAFRPASILSIIRTVVLTADVFQLFIKYTLTCYVQAGRRPFEAILRHTTTTATTAAAVTAITATTGPLVLLLILRQQTILLLLLLLRTATATTAAAAATTDYVPGTGVYCCCRPLS